MSCASAGNCTAVGDYSDSSGHEQGLLLTETSGTWATGVEASLPADAGRDPVVDLVSVSCASAGNCTAVGRYQDDLGNYYRHGLLLTETSGTWATGVEASLPANAGTTHTAGLNEVSCASAGNCTAVGYYERQLRPRTGAAVDRDVGDVGGRRRGIAARKRWHKPGTSQLGVVRLGGELHRRRLLRGQLGPLRGLLLSETSGTWAAGVEPSLPANAGTNQDAGLGSVSCASAGNCTAVGDYTDSSGHYTGTASFVERARADREPGLHRRRRHRQADLRTLGAPTLPGDRDADHDRDAQGGRPVALGASTRRNPARSSSPRRR